MPVPMVFGVGVRTTAEQLTGNLEESVRSFRRIAMHARMTHVKQWLPILSSTPLKGRYRMRSQTGLHCFGIAEHKFGEQVGVRDAFVLLQQPKSPVFGASSGAPDKLLDGGRKGERALFHVLSQVVPGFETIRAGDDELRVMQGYGLL